MSLAEFFISCVTCLNTFLLLIILVKGDRTVHYLIGALPLKLILEMRDKIDKEKNNNDANR